MSVSNRSLQGTFGYHQVRLPKSEDVVEHLFASMHIGSPFVSEESFEILGAQQTTYAGPYVQKTPQRQWSVCILPTST